MGIILFIIAVSLIALIGPLGLLVTFGYNLLRYGVRYGVKRLNYDLVVIAVAIDQVGNVMCKDLFNLCLIKKNGYRFGRRKETISSVIGKNRQSDTLTFLGKCLDKTLNLFEKNHSYKSIDLNV